MGKRILVLSLLLGLLGVGPAAPVSACVIPVFRYALERWQADRYELLVFHDRPLTDAEKRPLQGLAAGEEERLRGINVQLRFVHLRNSDDRELINFWESRPQPAETSDEPYVFLRAPLKGGNSPQTLWSGTLAQFTAQDLLDSPARQEIATRLVQGDSVVWLLIRKRTTPQDEQQEAQQQAAQQQEHQQLAAELETQLDELAGKLDLPSGIGEPGSELYSQLPLSIRFSVLEIDSEDPREQAFLSQLLRALGETRAVQELDEPMVVPVFGRGRALEAIPASKLTPKVCENVSKFLCGACSCQVKELNPGVDLLLDVDWDRQLFGPQGAPAEIRLENRPAGALKPEIIQIPTGRKK